MSDNSKLDKLDAQALISSIMSSMFSENKEPNPEKKDNDWQVDRHNNP